VLHKILGRFEEQGLARTHRDASSRHWTLTPAGRARLRARRHFARALATLIVRSQRRID
jgi:DNA-binding MarR family transcriptional regulator